MIKYEKIMKNKTKLIAIYGKIKIKTHTVEVAVIVVI